MKTEAPPRVARKSRGERIGESLHTESMRVQSTYDATRYDSVSPQSPILGELCWLVKRLENVIPEDAAVAARPFRERDGANALGVAVHIDLGGGVEARLIAASGSAPYVRVEGWADGGLCYGHYAPTADMERTASVLLQDMIRVAGIRARTNPT